MKKWIALSGLWIAVFLFHGYVCYADTVKLTIEVDSELYPYLEKTVNLYNDSNVGVEGFVLKNPSTYISMVIAPAVQSYKEQIQKAMVETPELKALALQLVSLPADKQAELKQFLADAVEANK